MNDPKIKNRDNGDKITSSQQLIIVINDKKNIKTEN